MAKFPEAESRLLNVKYVCIAMPVMQFAQPAAANAVTRTCAPRIRKEKRKLFLHFLFFNDYFLKIMLSSRLPVYLFSHIHRQTSRYSFCIPDSLCKTQRTRFSPHPHYIGLVSQFFVYT